MVSKISYDEVMLVAEFRRGKVRSFEEIFFKLNGAIRYFTGKFIEDEEAVEEIVAGVFVSAWERRGDFSSVKEIKAYLYISAREACSVYKRGYEVKALELDEFAKQQVYDAEVLREFYAGVKALPGDCKRVVMMTLQGLNVGEIAENLGMSVEAVGVAKKRAVVLLKEHYA